MKENQTSRDSKPSADKERAVALLFSTILPPRVSTGRKHTYVERLSQLRDAQETVFTPDEYAEWRSGILDELATFARVSFIIHCTLALCCAGCITLSVVGFTNHTWEFVVAGIPALICGLFIWYHMSRDAAAKRRLTEQDRLAALSELLSAGLVSEHEAAALRARIEQLFHNERNG